MKVIVLGNRKSGRHFARLIEKTNEFLKASTKPPIDLSVDIVQEDTNHPTLDVSCNFLEASLGKKITSHKVKKILSDQLYALDKADYLFIAGKVTDGKVSGIDKYIANLAITKDIPVLIMSGMLWYKMDKQGIFMASEVPVIRDNSMIIGSTNDYIIMSSLLIATTPQSISEEKDEDK